MSTRISKLCSWSILVGALAFGFVACDSGDEEPAQPVLDFEQARLEFPTVLDVQANVITHTCSPNPGVCHQGREYPELHTITSLAESIGAACNIAPPAPELGWDACERPPYWVQLADFGSAIAWKESTGAAQWTFGLANPIPAGTVPPEPLEEGAAEIFQILDDQLQLVFAPSDDWITTLSVSEDAMSLTVDVVPKDAAQDIAGLVDTLMAGVVEGDPNLNGVWGGLSSEAKAQMITPGSRKLSYLWRRLIGDVPGDRMPIANGPVTNAQLLALGCLIEGLDPEATSMQPHDVIDYDDCSFAEDPPLLVEELPEEAPEGEPNEGG